MGKLKRALLLAATLAVVFLSGCVDLQIDAGVDAENTAYLAYTLRADLADFRPEQREDLSLSLRALAGYYRTNLGFEAQGDYDGDDGDQYVLTMSKTVPCASADEAFEALRELLTDEQITPFMRVEMDSTGTDYQQAYLISAEVDMAKVMELSNAEEFAPDVRADFDAALAESGGSVTLRLPASAAESGTGTAALAGDGTAATTVAFTFQGPQTAKLSTRLNTSEPGAFGDDPAAAARSMRGAAAAAWVLAGIGAALALAGAILLILRLRRRHTPPPAGGAEHTETTTTGKR